VLRRDHSTLWYRQRILHGTDTSRNITVVLYGVASVDMYIYTRTHIYVYVCTYMNVQNMTILHMDAYVVLNGVASVDIHIYTHTHICKCVCMHSTECIKHDNHGYVCGVKWGGHSWYIYMYIHIYSIYMCISMHISICIV